MTNAEFHTIMDEIAESDLSARDFHIVNDILKKYLESEYGDDCTDSAD